MHSISSILKDMNENSHTQGDYYDDEGLLNCGKCHTRKQYKLTFGDNPARILELPTPCECRKMEIVAEEQQQARIKFQQQMESLRRDGITDQAYLQFTFDSDDQRNSKVSDVCQKYVDKWEDMKSNNIGILFYGDVGTGKSFLACCIANALLKKLVSVSVTNFPRILNQLQGTFDGERQEFINRLQRYSLLVIDDLGVERDTSYSVEQAFNLIDTRSRSNKPLIITTNLSMKDLESAPTLAHQRIYDRVLEMCPIRLKLVGESRRTMNANDKRDKARRFLGLT